MRLINTGTLKLGEFFGKNIPEYAILSHVWGPDEVTYQEWMAGDHASISSKGGYIKILGTCNKAFQDGLDWLWVDTNCIDKTSSAELTEAINSMFKWYADSRVCYAYLADVIMEGSPDWSTSFRQSRWFTRGWTLQELLAPKTLTFYSREWQRLGDRSDAWLLSAIAEATSIEVPYLTGHNQLNLASAAKRMSWLSRRETTREEDIAYCMLGIFEVNMPLLYGEGSRAFVRLQEEIIKISNDHSLFCWSFDSSVPPDWVSMLAPSPRAFKNSASYVQKDLREALTPYSMTNLGLSIQLPIIHTFTYALALLNAGLEQQSMSERACLPMRYDRSSTSAIRSTPTFARYSFPKDPVNIIRFDPPGMRRHQVFVRTRPTLLTTNPSTQPSYGGYGVLILMETTKSRLFDGSKPIGLMSRINSGDEIPYLEAPTIDTYPAHMFDFESSVLHLPQIKEESTSYVGCLLQIRHQSELHSGYLFFFGARKRSGGKREWICNIVTRESLASSQRGDGHWDLERIFKRYANRVLDKSSKEQLRATLPDNSLVLKMGAYINQTPFKSLRTAWFLGAKQESHSSEVQNNSDVSDVESTRGNIN